MHSVLGTFPGICYPNLQVSEATQKPCPIPGFGIPWDKESVA